MSPGRRRRDASGAAVVLVLVLVGLLTVVGVAAGGAAGVVVAHRRAQAAADLAALAAAAAIQRSRDPCAEASRIARANGAEAVVCEVDGEEVEVAAEVDLPPVLGKRRVRGLARAGP